MFGTTTRRGIAVSALVVSLSLTSLVGSAAASPSAEDTTGCSVLAHERNAGSHRLHEAWQGFNEQLRDLSREARELSRESRRSSSATTLTVDARADIADAKSELNAIRAAAHVEIQDRAELGTACKDAEETASGSPSVTDADADAPVTETENTDELSIDTSDLVEKYREVVDQAILDMQAVMDPLNAAVAEMLAASETAETTDDAAVTEKHGKAKADREAKEKSGKPEGAGKPADKGGKAKAPRG
jgi:hypothetical protein